MYCPKCRAEFREGFTQCKKCDVELVNELEPGEIKVKNSASLLKLTENNIEKWLKFGGLIYIFVGVAYAISNAFLRNFASLSTQNLFNSNFGQILALIISACFSVIEHIVWGLFFYGFGLITEIIKKGYRNEK